jgi:hypothetical protein
MKAVIHPVEKKRYSSLTLMQVVNTRTVTIVLKGLKWSSPQLLPVTTQFDHNSCKPDQDSITGITCHFLYKPDHYP